MKLSAKNIDIVIKGLRKQINSAPKPTFSGMYFPRIYRDGIDYQKYRGKGRPRKDDYIYRSMMKLLKKVSSHV